MRKVKLEYFENNGKIRSVRIATSSTEVVLGDKKIEHIFLFQLAAYPNLQRLDLQRNQLTTIDLSPLAKCTNLQEIDLSGNKLRTIDLAPLAACLNLQYLNLYWNMLTDIDLAPLSQCANLRKLSLSGNMLTDIDLAPLSQCTNLQELKLSSNKLTDIDFAPLSQCTNLQELKLISNELTDINLAPLAACPNLHNLSLSGNRLTDIDLAPLSQCPNLQRLDLQRNQLTTINLTPLQECINHMNLLFDDTVHLTVESWIPRNKLHLFEFLFASTPFASTPIEIIPTKSISEFKIEAEELAEREEYAAAAKALRRGLLQAESLEEIDIHLNEDERTELIHSLKTGILINETRLQCAILTSNIQVINSLRESDQSVHEIRRAIKNIESSSDSVITELNRVQIIGPKEASEAVKFLAAAKINEFRDAVKAAQVHIEEVIKKEKNDLLSLPHLTTKEAQLTLKAMVEDVHSKLKEVEQDLNLRKNLTETLLMAVKFGEQHGLSEKDFKEVKALLKTLRDVS